MTVNVSKLKHNLLCFIVTKGLVAHTDRSCKEDARKALVMLSLTTH